MVQNLLLLAVSLGLLTLGAEALVRGAVVLATRLGVSSFFIGLTIVGFGTSTPELAAGVSAALNDKPDINLGNVVGSNILNVALILGVASLITPTPVKTRLVKAEILVVIAVSLLCWALAFTGERIGRVEGTALLAILAVHIVRGYFVGKREGATAEVVVETVAHSAAEPAVEAAPRRAFQRALWFNLLLIAAGLGLLTFASDLLIGSASGIARSLGVSELAIALTIVAGGTSTPELATSVMAAMRKQSDIVVGNILGSNIFNICGILGITSLIAPPSVQQQILWLDAPVMVALAIALLPILFSGARISRAEGAALLVVAACYVTTLFTLAPKWFPPDAPPPDAATQQD
ncbi:MAG: calcium/sodium antiporter [Phycisphaerales bacterium]